MLLRKKIPFTMIALVSIPLIILSIIVYTYTSSALITVNKNRIRNISEIQSENLINIINAHTKELQLTAKIDEIIDVLILEHHNKLSSTEWALREEPNRVLEDILEESSELDNIFVANYKGEIILSGKHDALNRNIQDNQYFIDALNDKTAVSNALRDDQNDEKVIVMTAPVKNDHQEIVGVIGHIIKLDYFKNKITNVKMENQGYAYIVDAEGILVAHPDAKRVGTYIENTTIQEIVKKIKNQEVVLSGEGQYIYQGKQKYMAYSVIPQINWLIVFAQDKTEMNEPARIALILILVATLGFINLSIIASIEFSKSITEPVDQLIEAMDKAGNGDLNSKCNFKSHNEFGKLSTNFNNMLSQLNLSYHELAAVYDQLSATEEELRSQYEELQDSEEHLRKSEEKYKLALEGVNDIIWEWDNETKSLHVSNKWHDIVGDLPIRKISIRNFIRFIHKEDVKMVIKDIKDHLDGHTLFYKSEFRIQLGEEQFKWLLIRGKALHNAKGKMIKIAGSMTDISERKAIENEIKHMAYHDTLTSLPNRILFMKKLEKELERSKKEGLIGAIMLIDLDNFKNVNDTLGHDHGDKLLECIAEKLKVTVKGNNTVCRFGGDEFLVLYPQADSENQIRDFAKRILSIFENPLIINDKLTYMTASLGISVYPKDGEHTSHLLKNADVAMYTAKFLGKNTFLFFNQEMQEGLERKIKIEAILRQALIEDGFEIYYQPQIDVKGHKITGFEALLRLNSKEMGFISPGEFIPIAEESGLIKELGLWCLKHACLKNKEWRDKGYQFDSISVNISNVQFEQHNFVELIMEVLEQTQLKPEFLEIEITESVLMKSLEKNIEILEKLKAIGIKIALDDFGTGYSSFNYLRQLPINTLKMDKSFIDGICLNLKEQAIVHGIIQLAHQMALEVIAEGVENESQLKLLKLKDCDKVQGYFFSKPLPAREAEVFLKNF
ncbi:bifunctional diguanylate cyclase/phosphodiesterase [Cellulosilyticum sp. I15G10I2]|uniref:bifunctional diguanylate cyclase/phosphodiesterase n=1 Tax=Cellulosilyticum sp. I15G10I2 TaxID=1892843 RepID=UPI00085C39DD|nr:EAL domain-containing protein [Cellulosilyticum sp. I15G10I2]